MTQIRLVRSETDHGCPCVGAYRLIGEPISLQNHAPSTSRVAYAAAHLVANPLHDSISSIDWEATLAFRRYLWDLGLCVAEAMDTAQRGMGLDYYATKELVLRSVNEARACGGQVACGVGTDQIQSYSSLQLADVIEAYLEQCAYVEQVGGSIILMASRALASIAEGPEDYAKVYGAVLSQVSKPVILHWLGDMFDPALSGYWGSVKVEESMNVCLDIINSHASKVDGIKFSLLDERLEIQMRRRLPEQVKMYTGDDFHYPALIAGDGQDYSHALLGIFDAIAPAAAHALQSLESGDVEAFNQILAPTIPLSRHIFQYPTRFYKIGVVFLAFLNGHQAHFRMIGGIQGMRSIPHLCELFVLADQAGLLSDPESAVNRMREILTAVGVE